MSVPVSSSVSTVPPAPPGPLSAPQVLPEHIWAKLSSDVRARAIGLFAQLALNLVLACARADAHCAVNVTSNVTSTEVADARCY